MCGIIMLIFGIIALVKGQFSLKRNRVVDGVPARIIGVILMLPFPLSFCIGFGIGVIAGVQQKKLDPLSLVPIDLGLVAICLIAALGLAFATAHPPRKKRLRRREEEYEDYDEDYPYDPEEK